MWMVRKIVNGLLRPYLGPTHGKIRGFDVPMEEANVVNSLNALQKATKYFQNLPPWNGSKVYVIYFGGSQNVDS